ncbi:hypothetical protein FKP32DRAFT_1468222 [Trametes sanguinea]|nr:hypothetical protein FKP32DRAFT_1468222 [Trametes sanguinea]
MSSIPASSEGFLPHVKNITLYTTILKAAAVLRATTSQILQCLQLTFSGMRTVVDLPSFTGPLAPSVQRFSSTLQSITIHFFWKHDIAAGPRQDALQPFTPWLSPLLSLHALAKVELRLLGVILHVSTQNVRSMACAWPRITWLRVLDDDYIVSNNDAPTPDWQLAPVPVSALLAFAEHCPSLKHLVLSPLYLTQDDCSMKSWRPSADSVSAPQLLTLAANFFPCAREDRPRVDCGGTTETPSCMRPFLDAIFPNAKRTFWVWYVFDASVYA